MADETSKPNPRWSVTFKSAKIRLPFYVPSVPQEFLSFLGQIAILWGQYEKELNDCIVMLTSYNGARLEDNWHFRLSYEQRANRFCKEAQQTFELYPLIYLHLKKIINDAVQLQTKRNLLLHGFISLRMMAGDPNMVIHAVGSRKGQPVELSLSLDELETLFYELAHLAGRMAMFNVPSELPALPYFSSHDIRLVQDLLRKHHPAGTSLNKRQSPPEPSQA